MRFGGILQVDSFDCLIIIEKKYRRVKCFEII